MVDKTYKDLYHTIIKSHEQSKTSLTVKELKSLHESINSTMSNAKKQSLEPVYKALEETPVFEQAVQEHIIQNKFLELTAMEISKVSMDMADSKDDKSVESLQILLDNLKKLKMKPEDRDKTLIDIDEIFDDTIEFKWKFNLADLQERLGGIGPGYFGIVAARPDAGKTGFYISLTASTDGWLAQGAKVHIIGNEEAPRRIKQRIISAITGWNKKEIIANKEKAKEIWAKVSPNCHVIADIPMTMGSLDQYASTLDIDILVIDQLDKMSISGKQATNEERLKGVYIQAREIAKKHNCAVIGICQAGFSAHNKLHYGFECLDGSKTGKAAECDWCVTIGMETNARGEDNYYRMANIPKNKLTGKKGPVPFILEPDLSRIHV